MSGNNTGRRADPFRPLLIDSLEQTGNSHSQDWANRLRSEHSIEKGKLEGPKGGITPEMLVQQHGKLRKVNEVNTPWADNLKIKRDGRFTTHTSGAAFTDFVRQTRDDLTTLASTSSGQDIFNKIKTAPKHSVAIQDAGTSPGLRESSRTLDLTNSVYDPLHIPGFSKPLMYHGKGSSAEVAHHTDFQKRTSGIDGVTTPNAVGLGHELIHAAHAVQGRRMAEDQTQSVRPEERETVGKTDGSRGYGGHPTENSIRKDLNEQVYNDSGKVGKIAMRKKYGGQNL
ncbi:hypothetical protein tinsulaeT_14620 [Thalassotalea insulae]|uniref:NleD-like pathogen effector protein (Putative zinc metallopeptidase) n=1 Tax=Thalassotalea insulae TaxID=2056778 RepID=A0ABQ6GTY4_9GAMM|nr:M91 family zinc metallopeptidase [Thalassotalea insulae]GLX78122.1 hypothetical protein tinsulaeT_14620 [Thalassotalea insulae]